MIITFTAVGEQYIKLLLDNLDGYLELGYIIEVLTDDPPKFYHKDVTVTKYENRIFNYFDKLLFLFRKINEHKSPGVFLDVTKLSVYNPILLKNEFFKKEPILIGFYREFKHIVNLEKDHSLRFVRNYIHTFDISEKFTLKHLIEEFIYFPYMDILPDLIIQLEKLKIVFSFQTLMDEQSPTYTHRFKVPHILGYGEGVALHLLFHIFDIHYIVLSKFSPTQHKGLI